MRTFRRAACILSALAAGLGAAAWVWLQAPAGNAAVSRWISRRVQESAPGSSVELKALRLRWPLRAEAQQLIWRDRSGRLLAEAENVRGRIDLRAGRLRRPDWEIQAEVTRLDLAVLDGSMLGGKWGASGFLRGDVRMRGGGPEPAEVDLHLSTEAPGGDVKSEFLQGLVGMMPANDNRALLLGALGSKPQFHFNVGEVEVSTESSGYTFRVLIDGDHRLDITLRVPRDGWEILKALTT